MHGQTDNKNRNEIMKHPPQFSLHAHPWNSIIINKMLHFT